MAKRVAVCGRPGSGNRVTRAYCRHLGWQATIWHGNKNGPALPVREDGEDVRCIIPVRHSPAARLSQPQPDEYEGAYRSKALAWAATVPCYLLSYEALCMDPEGVFRDLAEFLGEEYSPAPFEIYDGTRRRLELETT